MTVDEFQCFLLSKFKFVGNALHVKKPIYRVPNDEKKGIPGSRYIDIVVFCMSEGEHIAFPIELKYKTAELNDLFYEDEIFNLKGHSAPDEGRYDCLKDIKRLEQLSDLDGKRVEKGCAIWLTNASCYWVGSENRGAKDAEFSINCGREIPIGKELKWGYGIETVTESRRSSLKFSSPYTIKWRIYSELQSEENGVLKNGTFKYALIEIPTR